MQEPYLKKDGRQKVIHCLCEGGNQFLHRDIAGATSQLQVWQEPHRQ